MPNFNLEVSGLSGNSAGLKCDGAQYTKMFSACYKHVAENGAKLKTSADAVSAFWKEWDKISAPFHTGDSGKRKYSAPFLSAIAAAYVESAAKTAKTA